MTEQAMTAEQWHAKFLYEGITKRAADLREIADRIERSAADVGRVGAPGNSTYSRAVEEIVHTLMWGLANLNVHGLISDAAQADIARARHADSEETR